MLITPFPSENVADVAVDERSKLCELHQSHHATSTRTGGIQVQQLHAPI